MDQVKKDELIDINRQQTEFYDHDLDRAGSLPTRIWRNFRRKLIAANKEIGINRAINDLHRQWMGDLSDKRVLDLGCFAGNPLSVEIARSSREYLGIDLSESALKKLQAKLERNRIPHARVRAVDFLSDEFAHEKFDFIYARAVAHHFKYFEVFLEQLRDHLNPGGMVITYDPLQTYWPLYMLRRLYRPFQSDKEWEFPFTKKSITDIQKYFRIREVQGVLGKAKWSLPMMLLPGKTPLRIGKKWLQKDLQEVNRINPALWSCLQITMLLDKT